MKKGFMELNHFIKKYYGLRDSALVNKRTVIVRLVKRRDRADLFFNVNNQKCVNVKQFYEFLDAEEKASHDLGKDGRLSRRLIQ